MVRTRARQNNIIIMHTSKLRYGYKFYGKKSQQCSSAIFEKKKKTFENSIDV